MQLRMQGIVILTKIYFALNSIPVPLKILKFSMAGDAIWEYI
jgi:hypothetical protein